MSAALDRAAERAGILLEPRWGGAPPLPDSTKEALVALLGDGPPPASAKPAAQDAAFVPPFLDETRIFGVALQLYQLRSPRNLGIGDLADLRALLVPLARQGVDVVGLNPLHALFTAAPERASPFSPSDRRFLNPLVIAVEDVPGYQADMRRRVFVPGAQDSIDYTAVAAAKLSILREIHARWRARDPGVPAIAHQAAARHRSEGGAALEAFALFEALSHQMVRDGHGAGWRGWPAAYQQRHSAEVRAFREAHAGEIAFHAFLQFIAAEQLRATQEAAREAGMRIGLYLDLAVGAAPDGASTWADPDLVLRGIRVGAPPDLFTADGQDWGLAPLSPATLRSRDFAPYRAILSAVMAHAGATRIDHAMGLERLFLIPDGIPTIEGAYVRMDGLIDVLVAESHRNGALAIGEDLGVVPPGFRERMASRRIFSTRILPFERDGVLMRPPARYPVDSLACLSTHDIAPLEAWWQGDDIAIRKAIGHLRPTDTIAARNGRREEKALMCALAGLPPTAAARALTDDIVVAFHRVAARSRSSMVAVRLEDVVGGRRLVNLPGTDREHPNWRNTLPLTVADIGRSERLARTLAAMRAERPR
ncbi:MAG: 4-alpha-glucanotransferase [Acuticoccus sp.]